MKINMINQQEYGLCSNCNQQNTFLNWCQNCNSKRFQKNFSEWTSGNKFIDKFIQDVQLKARNQWEILEWIQYNNLRNIKFLAEGGFSIIYKAILLGGYIEEWDSEKQQWKRDFKKLKDEDYENTKQENIKSPLSKNEEFGEYDVLKSLNNSTSINDDFLNEWKNYLSFVYSAENDNSGSIRLYGITQDPETLNYMIVMEYMKLGNLRSNLKIKKYYPYNKYHNLRRIAKSLSTLHKCGLVHGDFHSGNLLLRNYDLIFISDLGLSRPADKSTKSNEIYGVIPYIAPEVLRGKQYTKAADIYSFGIIMWEMISGIPAFNDVPHDFHLALNICQELRPEIVKLPKNFESLDEQSILKNLEVEYIELMKRCWDSNPNKRPTAKELNESFYRWHCKCLLSNEKSISEIESIVENHSSSSYISRKIDFSVKLNEYLNQEELSSKIIIDSNEEDDLIMSESLDSYKISSSKVSKFI